MIAGMHSHQPDLSSVCRGQPSQTRLDTPLADIGNSLGSLLQPATAGTSVGSAAVHAMFTPAAAHHSAPNPDDQHTEAPSLVESHLAAAQAAPHLETQLAKVPTLTQAASAAPEALSLTQPDRAPGQIQSLQIAPGASLQPLHLHFETGHSPFMQPTPELQPSASPHMFTSALGLGAAQDSISTDLMLPATPSPASALQLAAAIAPLPSARHMKLQQQQPPQCRQHPADAACMASCSCKCRGSCKFSTINESCIASAAAAAKPFAACTGPCRDACGEGAGAMQRDWVPGCAAAGGCWGGAQAAAPAQLGDAQLQRPC